MSRLFEVSDGILLMEAQCWRILDEKQSMEVSLGYHCKRFTFRGWEADHRSTESGVNPVTKVKSRLEVR